MPNFKPLATGAGMLGASLGSMYSSDAEASKFTDSLKLIDKFLAAHGTPHVFPPEPDNALGAFKWDKINSGEGVQAFTRGHYLAGNPKISKVHYRDKLVGALNRDILSNNGYDANARKMAEKAVKNHLFNTNDSLQVEGLDLTPAQQTTIVKLALQEKTAPNKALASLLDPKKFRQAWKSDNMGFIKPNGELEDFTPEVVRQLHNAIMTSDPADLYTTENLTKFKALADKSKAVDKLLDRSVVFNAKVDENTAAPLSTLDRRSQILEGYRKEWVNNYLRTNGLPELQAGEATQGYTNGVWSVNPIVNQLPEKVKKEYYRAFDRHIAKATMETLAEYAAEHPELGENITQEAVMQYSGINNLYNRIKKIAINKALEPKVGALKQLQEETLAKNPKAELKRGALYTVEVGASPSTLLPLDMPLGEIKEDLPDVYNAFKEVYENLASRDKLLNDSATPLQLWGRNLPSNKATQNAFSKGLNERGVPGAMFLANSKRGLNTNYAFDPAKFNYVMYNDETPRIVDMELGPEVADKPW